MCVCVCVCSAVRLSLCECVSPSLCVARAARNAQPFFAYAKNAACVSFWSASVFTTHRTPATPPPPLLSSCSAVVIVVAAAFAALI